MKESKQTLIKYLLGELPELEQTSLEQKYFADPQLFDQLVEAENDLADQYARGELSAETRRRFEQHYLTHPARRERVRFADLLTARLDRAAALPSTAVPAESWRRRLLSALQGPKLVWAFSVALVLLIAVVVWFAIQTRRLHQELAAKEAEQLASGQRQHELQQQLAGERSRAEELASAVDRMRSGGGASQSSAPPTPAAALVASLVLNLTGVRGTQSSPPPRLVIEPDTVQARIQLNLSDNDYQKYSVAIQSADGKQIFKREGLRSSGKTRTSLSLVVPTNKLSSGDYILTLRGVTSAGEVEDLSKSFFRVSLTRPR